MPQSHLFLNLRVTAYSHGNTMIPLSGRGSLLHRNQIFDLLCNQWAGFYMIGTSAMKDVGTLQMCPIKKRKDSKKNTFGEWKLRRTQRLLLRRIFLFGDWKSDKNDENCFMYHLKRTFWFSDHVKKRLD